MYQQTFLSRLTVMDLPFQQTWWTPHQIRLLLYETVHPETNLYIFVSTTWGEALTGVLWPLTDGQWEVFLLLIVAQCWDANMERRCSACAAAERGPTLMNSMMRFMFFFKYLWHLRTLESVCSYLWILVHPIFIIKGPPVQLKQYLSPRVMTFHEIPNMDKNTKWEMARFNVVLVPSVPILFCEPVRWHLCVASYGLYICPKKMLDSDLTDTTDLIKSTVIPMDQAHATE